MAGGENEAGKGEREVAGSPRRGDPMTLASLSLHFMTTPALGVLLGMMRWWVLPPTLALGILAVFVAWRWVTAPEREGASDTGGARASAGLVGPERADRLGVVFLATHAWWVAAAIAVGMNLYYGRPSTWNWPYDAPWADVAPVALTFVLFFVRAAVAVLDYRHPAPPKPEEKTQEGGET